MDDYKMRAAGERTDYAEHERMRREYVRGALEWLLTFTRAELTGDEIVRWEERLLTIPHWKLRRLTEFSRPFLNEVWDFFEQLHYAPDQAPGPKKIDEPKTEIGRDTLTHIRKILDFPGPRAERLQLEQAGLKTLHQKYPGAGFDGVLREKRFCLFREGS